MPITPQSTSTSGSDDQHSKPVSIWHRDVSSFFKRRHTPKASLREIPIFCRKMSFLLGAGIHIKSALSIVSEQLPGRGISRHMSGLNARVQQGESFSQAAKATGAFPAFFHGFVAIGEAAARLPQVMEQLADFYEDQAQTRDELTAVLVYPIAVTIIMLGVIIMAVTLVLPGYSRIFAATGVPLPPLTRGLLHISDFLTANALWVIVGMIAAFAAAALFIRGNRGQNIVAAAKLRIPIVRQGVNFRLTQALHMLLSAGLPVSQALPLAEGVMDNIHVRRDLNKISTQLEMGKPFWEALQGVTYIDPLLVGLARVGEETGYMTQTMEKCQNYYAQAYKKSIRRLSKLVEPIITLILGIGLGIIMLAVILPTFELATIM